jgi:two-component system LytT family response regulator
VVDDEPLARSNLTVLLQRDPEIEIVGECESGMQALSEIRSKKPDLVFLDVQMPECDGFDVLELLGTDMPPALVFVTAYDQYALRAFEAGALDYLLKPFDNARFERALQRAKERIALGRDPQNQDLQKHDLQKKDARNEHPQKKVEHLVVKSAGQVSFLRVSEIDWIEAADYYVSLHVAKRTHLLRRSLFEVEQELDQAGFCRIHRSAIVNLDRVRGLEINEDGGHSVLLDDGTRLRLSRRYGKQLQARLGLRDSASA